MIELEKKLPISKEEYDYLMDRFGYDNQKCRKPMQKQINYYFDTDDLLMNKQNTTCRIRLKNGIYKATMKQHSPNGDQSTETEMEIRTGLESNAFTDMGLKLKGALVTERCIILKDHGCEVVLDKNEYLGHTDYELEIEYAPSSEHHSKHLLNTMIHCLANNVSGDTTQALYNLTREAPSKSTRFFERFSLKERKRLYALSSQNHG